MNPTCDEYISELRHTVSVAVLNYDIWWVYKSDRTRPQYIDTMNRYRIFFTTSIHAHFVALIVALYRLYEKRRDTHNIPGLIELVEKEGLLSATALASVRAKSDGARPLWNKVAVVRNKAFGHRSAAHTDEDVFREAGVSPNDLKQLLDISKTLLNELTQERSNNVHAWNLSGTHDVERLLTDLGAGRSAL